MHKDVLRHPHVRLHYAIIKIQVEFLTSPLAELYLLGNWVLIKKGNTSFNNVKQRVVLNLTLDLPA